METNSRIFTSVKGVSYYGLIVDPGASKGLIGEDTLNDIIQRVLKPAGKAHLVKWRRSSAAFTGISSTQKSQR